jgi:hypothetical protein
MRESSTVACNEARSSRSTTHVDELFQALQRLDQRLERAMLSAQATYGAAVAADSYRGLYISAQEAVIQSRVFMGSSIIKAGHGT